MRRLWIPVVLLLLCALPAHGQSTTVSGTITDAGSQAWANGSYKFTFAPNPQFPTGPYTWTGGSLTLVISGSLDSSGHYSVSIPSNTAITPAGSTWVLQVTPKASSPSFSTPRTTVTGGTQTLSPTPPAISIAWQNPPGPAISAYVDGEITGSLPPGAEYFNTSALLTRVWDGSAWKNQGTGGGPPGGGSSIDPTQFPYNVKADARYQQGNAADGVTTSGTPTLTAASLNCTAADVGKLVEAINTVNGASAFGSTQRAYVGSCASSTVANVVDVNGNPINAVLSSGAPLNWAIGTDNTPNNTGGLIAAWHAALVGNSGVTLPCGAMMVSAPPFVDQTPVSSWQSADVAGCLGNSNTMFIGYPTLTQTILTGGTLFYNFPPCSNCAGAPGVGPYPDIHNFKFTGLEVAYPATSGVFSWGTSTLAKYVQVEYFSIGGGGTLSNVLNWTSGEAFYERLNVQAISTHGSGGDFINFAGQGTNVLKDSILAIGTNGVLFCNAAVCDLDSDYVTQVGGGGGDLISSNNAIVNVRGGTYTTSSSFTNNIFGTNGGAGTIHLSQVSASAVTGSFGINVGTGGVAIVEASTISGQTPANAVTGTGGTFIDVGGNTITGFSGSVSIIGPSYVPTTLSLLGAASSANKGSIRVISDSTAVAAEGQTCVGSSTNTALAFSNGTVWKCF